MTKDEANRLIAERLFGWKRLTANVLTWHIPLWRSPDGKMHTLPDIPNYVGTWEGAGKVIEEMRKRFDARLDVTSKYNHSPERNRVEYGAWFVLPPDGKTGLGCADSGPEAIAKAALAALEEKTNADTP